jgi:hypothetical protein
MGIPARMAGGVRCSERLGPGRYRARYRNAHAWVEVPCRRAGFVAFDFTPADDRAEPSAGRAEADRAAAGTEPGEATDRAETRALDWSDPFRYGRNEQRWLLRRIGRGLGTVAVPVLAVGFVLVLLWALVVAWRRRGEAVRALTVRAPPGTPRRTLAFYARWLRACARQGFRRRPTQTPREFLATLPEELRVEGRGLTARFEARRYGAVG